MANSFVPVYKRMIQNEREAKRCCLFLHARIQIASLERHPRLGNSRSQPGKIPDSLRPTSLLHHLAVQGQYLRKRQMAHYANRRYSSRFFSRTREAASRKSASR